MLRNTNSGAGRSSRALDSSWPLIVFFDDREKWNTLLGTLDCTIEMLLEHIFSSKNSKSNIVGDMTSLLEMLRQGHISTISKEHAF
jgi:hypothetical protein